MGFEFHLGFAVWDELGEEFRRILGGEEGLLTLAVGLSSGGEAYEHEYHEHVHVETAFTMRVRRKASEIEEKLEAKTHLHLHPNSGTITFSMQVNSENMLEKFRRILEEMAKCEGCYITGFEGEVRVGEELAVLIHGSSAKATFILPSQDGRRLRVVEALLTD